MRFFRKVLILFYNFCIKINFYFGAACVLTLLTRSLNKKNNYRVLCLNKSIFSNDLNEIKKIDGKLQFLSFPRLLLSEIIKKYVPNFEQLNDSSYHKILDGTIEQKKIFNAMTSIFKYLHYMLRFDAVFAGNYVYVSQQEFFRVAKIEEIPVIVLYKEGIGAAIKSTSEIRNRMYSGKVFLGDNILFYNSAIKKMLIDAKIPGININNSHVVGIPRLDNYLKIKKNNSVNIKHITLFAFEPEIKAERFVENTTKKIDYVKRSESFHTNFVKFCSQHSNYSLTIKTKNNPDSRNSILKIFKNNGIDILPPNVQITSTEDPLQLIQRSQFIAGSLSTTLLEAMLLDKPIFCPAYNDIITDGRIDFFDNYPNSVNYVQSLTKVSDQLLGKIKINLASHQSKKLILEPLMYKIDGNASLRTHKKITSIINSKNKV